MKGPVVLDRVLTAIFRYNMLAPDDRVIVAISGGPDSVCLFHVLRALAPRLSIRIAGIAHLNHKLRGGASDADEAFVQDLAHCHDVPFYRAEADLSGGNGNLEQEARRARLAFFDTLIQDRAGNRVALGHTRDDQAETVLFRVLRGSGLAGLAGIHPVTAGGLVRPLIETSRVEVEAFLRQGGIAWREDASNREDRFARNRIRNHLLPQLSRDWNPRLAEALAHLADLAGEEESYWAGEVERLAPEFIQVSQGEVNVRASIANAPRAVARRLIRYALGKAKGDLRRLDFAHVERVLELAAEPQAGGSMTLPGIDVVRSNGWLRLTRKT